MFIETFFACTSCDFACASLRRGRPGLTGKTRRTYRRGYPAANSLSRIFVRIGYRLNGLPYTIPIRCQALWIVLLGIATPCYSVVTICRSSGGASRSTGSGIPVTTVMRRMLASKISVEEVR